MFAFFAMQMTGPMHHSTGRQKASEEASGPQQPSTLRLTFRQLLVDTPPLIGCLPNCPPARSSLNLHSTDMAADPEVSREEGEIASNEPDFSKKHPLENRWTLWFDNPQVST